MTALPARSLAQRLAGAFTSLLALCALPSAAEPESPANEPPRVAGPFTLQTLKKRSSLQFNANYGFVRVTYYERRVLHRGQPVALTGAEGRPATEFRDAWVLPDAEQPALLIGGAGWWLLTERDGRPQAQRLSESGSSLQWADRADAAAPRVGHVRTQDGEPMVLQGGRLLLLDGRLLLDTRSLRAQPLAPEVPAGYRTVDGGGLLGVSPDARAVALLYVGESQSARDALIVVASTERAGRSLLPLDLQALTGSSSIVAAPGLLQRHFDWQLRDGAPPQLQPRAAAARTPWQSNYLFGMRAPRGRNGQPLPSFTLAPVRPTLLAALRQELIDELGFEAQPPQPGDGDATRFARLKGSHVPLALRLDSAQRTLVVESDYPESVLWAQQAVRLVGEHLETRLAAGALREHLAPR